MSHRAIFVLSLGAVAGLACRAELSRIGCARDENCPTGNVCRNRFCVSADGGAAGGGGLTGGGLAAGGASGGLAGGSAGGAGGGTSGGGSAGGGAAVADGGAGGMGGGAAGGATGPTVTTITAVQQGTLAAGTCVQVSGVAVSSVFPDGDDAVVLDGGARAPRDAFYLSEKNLTTTTPFSGIEVVSTLPTAPMVTAGDDLLVVGEYVENFNNSTLRLTPTCGALTKSGTATMPQPAIVTLAQVGQSGGSSGCPPTGAGWVDGSNAEEYEGVLVRVQNGSVSSGRDAFGVFEVSSSGDRLQVSTSFGLTASPAIGGAIMSITGFGHFSFCRRKLRPRTDAEVNIAASMICGPATRTNHLVVTEIAVTPTPGEFIEIWNPTSTAISLTNVYVYNATFQANDGGTNCSYPLAVSGGACGTAFSDFNLRFPAGASIAAGEFQTIALVGASNFCAYHSCAVLRPTYEIAGTGQPDDPLVANMLGVFDNRATNFPADGGGGLGFLTNAGEEVVLYSWDGMAATVQDVDYVVWGSSTAYRTDKTGLAGYQPDTAITSQRAVGGTASASTSFQRLCTNEGVERRTSGNGLTAHDETSEDLDVTWVIQTATPGAQTAGAAF